MCRWVLYYGDSILLADLLIEPNNSLLRQSEPERELYTPSAEEEAVYDPNKHNLRNHHVTIEFFTSFLCPCLFLLVFLSSVL